MIPTIKPLEQWTGTAKTIPTGTSVMPLHQSGRQLVSTGMLGLVLVIGSWAIPTPNLLYRTYTSEWGSFTDTKSKTSFGQTETRTVGEQLRAIRKAFGLNATDLATLLGVSRPTIYAWMDNRQEPKPGATLKILELVRTADKFAAIGLRRPDNLTKRPLFENGASLFDLLQQGEEVYTKFSALREIDNKEAAVRESHRSSGPLVRTFDETVSEESTPLYFQ